MKELFSLGEKICGIYKIVSPTGKVYIGQSIDCLKRKGTYGRSSCKTQPKLFNSIKKHGWGKHSFEIIHRCDISELNSLEIYYVQLFNSTDKDHGLNLKGGGGSIGKFTEESRNKMSQSQKKLYAAGYIAPSTGTDRRFFGMYGKKHSDKTKLEHSQRMKGRSSWNKGIARTEKEKQQHSEKMKGKPSWNKGISCSEETKRKISETKRSATLHN